MVSPRFRGVAAGDQLGNLEYLIDEALVSEYARVAGESARYANLMADDCGSIVAAKLGGDGLRVVWRRFEFLRPPIPGRRVQVGAWLKDVGETRGTPWFRVSAFAVDEIGTEILRSEAALLAGDRGGNPDREVHAGCDLSTNETGCGFEGRVGESLAFGELAVPGAGAFDTYQKLCNNLSGTENQSTNAGAGQLLAGWLEGRMAWHFGDDFRWGGRLSLAYHAPVAPGDMIGADAVVIDQDRDHHGTLAIRLTLRAWNQRNESVALCGASVDIPSPRLL